MNKRNLFIFIISITLSVGLAVRYDTVLGMPEKPKPKEIWVVSCESMRGSSVRSWYKPIIEPGVITIFNDKGIPAYLVSHTTCLIYRDESGTQKLSLPIV